MIRAQEVTRRFYGWRYSWISARRIANSVGNGIQYGHLCKNMQVNFNPTFMNYCCHCFGMNKITSENCSCAPTTPSLTPIRILATDDPPYAMGCLESYPHDKECSHPGLETEYIHTIISKMMGRAIQWVKVKNYDEMDNYLVEGKGDIMGISYILDISMTRR